jgi:hypothetical protein
VLGRQRQRLLWLAPLIVAVLAYKLSEKRLEEVIALAIVVGVFAVLVQRPGAALIALIVFLPIESVLFGFLLGLHVPASLLRPASAFKELMAVCVLFAALRRLRDGEERLDRIDKALLTYVGVTTVYLIIPHLFSPTAPSSWTVRLLAWRADCAYILVFFAARHAGISEASKRRFVKVVLALGWLVVLCGLYQRLAPGSWTHFMIDRAKQMEYLVAVLKEPVAAVTQGLHFITNTHPLEVSSTFVSPYDMADYLMLIVGITAARVVRERRAPSNYVLLAGAVAVLFFSRIRADSLGALIILVVAVLPAPRRPTEARIRMVVGILLAAVVIVPSLAGTRYVGAQGGSQSNHIHVGEFEHGVEVAVQHPLGLGIGDQAATATKYQAETGLPPSTLLSSGSVAQVSDELGLQALIPWLITMGFIFWELRRRARGPDDLVTGAGLGFLGLFVAAQFHHAFITYPVPWTMFAAIGLALPGIRTDTLDSDQAVPEPLAVR